MSMTPRPLSENAKTLYHSLVPDMKVTGTKAKERSGLTDHDYKKAKRELARWGAVALGKGRGGSITRIESDVPEPEKDETAKPETSTDSSPNYFRLSKNKDTRLFQEACVRIVARELNADPSRVKALDDPIGWYVEVHQNGGAELYRVSDDAIAAELGRTS